MPALVGGVLVMASTQSAVDAGVGCDGNEKRGLGNVSSAAVAVKVNGKGVHLGADKVQRKTSVIALTLMNLQMIYLHVDGTNANAIHQWKWQTEGLGAWGAVADSRLRVPTSTPSIWSDEEEVQ